MKQPLMRRVWSVALTGVPFGVFKIGGGVAAWTDLHPVIGLTFVLWGVADILLNLLSVPFPRQISHCLLSNLGRRLDRAARAGSREQLLLAVDTLAAFAVVSSMLWFGRIATLPAALVAAWELSVIANILGVGLERVWRSWPRSDLAAEG